MVPGQCDLSLFLLFFFAPMLVGSYLPNQELNVGHGSESP